MKSWYRKNPYGASPKLGVCLGCKESFYFKYGRRAKYCSNKCVTDSFKKHIVRQCLVCHKNMRVIPSRLKTHRYCSGSCASGVRVGEKAANWQGGKTIERTRIMSTLAYKNWRAAVFERDGYACVACGDDTGGNLEADHIKPFSLYPELRFDIDNGRTLCIPCHKNTDTWGKKIITYNKKFKISEAI